MLALQRVFVMLAYASASASAAFVGRGVSKRILSHRAVFASVDHVQFPPLPSNVYTCISSSRSFSNSRSRSSSSSSSSPSGSTRVASTSSATAGTDNRSYSSTSDDDGNCNTNNDANTSGPQTEANLSVVEKEYLVQVEKVTLSSVMSTGGLANANASTSTNARTPGGSSALVDAYALPQSPPDFVKLQKGQRVVAFGDVHGDIQALKEFLVIAQVMDPDSSTDNPVWTGGETFCVQCGDILDRGDDELACYRLLASLSRQASETGGHLALLYGNHETLNAAGLFQYANPGGNAEYERDIGHVVDKTLGTDRWRLQFAGNQPSRWAAMEPGGLLAEPLFANMKVAIAVGRTVFVHAGLTADHLKEYGGIQGMNEEARHWILQNHHGDNNNIGRFESVEEILESAQERSQVASKAMPGCLGGGRGTSQAQSPVWMRDYSSPNDTAPKNPKAQQMIDEALEELGNDVQRMVMGHTPQHSINAALGGKAWRIDVGASRGVQSGVPEVLEIIHGGEEADDVVSVLSKAGRYASSDRQVLEMLF